MHAFAPEFNQSMANLLNPARGLESRAVPGGTAPSAVREALARAREVVARLPE
jgi:argininosuccinate lyase